MEADSTAGGVGWGQDTWSDEVPDPLLPLARACLCPANDSPCPTTPALFPGRLALKQKRGGSRSLYSFFAAIKVGWVVLEESHVLHASCGQYVLPAAPPGGSKL